MWIIDQKSQFVITTVQATQETFPIKKKQGRISMDILGLFMKT